MVESRIIEPKDTEINAENLLQEMRRLENLSFFISLDDKAEVEYILSRAGYELVDWHCTLKMRMVFIDFASWKTAARKNFAKARFSIGDIYKMKQNPGERVAGYIKRVAKESASYGISDKEVLEVVIAGMKEGREISDDN